MQFLAIKDTEGMAASIICAEDIAAIETSDGGCKVTLVRSGCTVEVQVPRSVEYVLGRLQEIEAGGGPKVLA